MQSAPSLEMEVEQIRANQNLFLGFVGGVAGAAIGAVLWAAITAATHFQIGFMAVGVGILVGFGIRILGKGIDPMFGMMGAGLALVGCVSGNLLAVCIEATGELQVSLWEILSKMTPSMAIELLQATFHPLDILFYGIALYEGYRLSFVRLG